MTNSAYIKTWIGKLAPQSSYESAGQPRGGGWGVVRNLHFSNFNVQGASSGPAINQDSGNNGSFSGTSLMEVSNVVFENFTGYLDNKTTEASVSCTTVHPCFNIVFKNITLDANEGGALDTTGTCKYIAPGGVFGLSGTNCTSNCSSA